MDRTNEFQSMMGLRGSQPVKSQAEFNTASNQELASRTSFNADASRIGQEIHIAQLKLDEIGKCMCILVCLIVSFHSGPSAEYF